MELEPFQDGTVVVEADSPSVLAERVDVIRKDYFIRGVKFVPPSEFYRVWVAFIFHSGKMRSKG